MSYKLKPAMRRTYKSLRNALVGFAHALLTERNFKLFVTVYVCVLLLGALLRISLWEWLALLLSGGNFLSIELLNTALERLTDVCDEYRKASEPMAKLHTGLKAAKDVASAAALVSFIIVGLVIVIIGGNQMIR